MLLGSLDQETEKRKYWHRQKQSTKRAQYIFGEQFP